MNIDRADAAGKLDNVPDVQIYVRFGKSSGGACGVPLQNVPGAGGTFSGAIETVLTSTTGLKALAGLRNDPFFFDAEGYAALLNSAAKPGKSADLVGAFRLSGGRARRDSFALRNVSAVVFEMDNDAVAPKLIGLAA